MPPQAWADIDDYVRFCRGRLTDPYPLYAELRTKEPVHWSELVNSWILTEYKNVAAALQYDPRITAERLNALIRQLPAAMQAEMGQLREHLSTWMQYYDPPEHSRLRGAVNRPFTPRAVEALRARVQAIVDQILDVAAARGRMDVISELAYPLPAIVVAEVLGVPPEDRDRFKGWADDIASFLEGIGADFSRVTRQAQASVLALMEYLRGLVVERRERPMDDLLTGLLQLHERDHRISEAELFGTCVFMMQAGHETTTGLIGNGLRALAQHPAQRQQLHDDPSLIDSAVEELLRYDSPVQRISRVVKQDFELDGQTLRAGQRIWAMLGAANRDPSQFSEPNRLDLTRSPNRHLAFGYGVHFCLGAPLARIEGQVALATVIRRFPDYLVDATAIRWFEGVSLHRLTTMPVTLSEAGRA
jgi:cytochrome P450